MSATPPKPLKRSPALISFSKDHHFALLLVWKIRQGLSKGVQSERINNYAVHVFNAELEPHFMHEEEFLLSNMAEEHPLRIQTEVEHETIRGMIATMERNPADGELPEKFAKALEGHIRFEERELFQYLQEHIPESDLLEITLAMNARDPYQETPWDDIFWGKKKE